ncbi:methyltransferase domain-containing protein [Patescibacteria group bacterium]|nr:methyltransferase domain-containing protein [Patescibacteria group bacterium]MBU1890072.1 methyltransferase domain-containing protein [Patescibacteria group bacterium]
MVERVASGNELLDPQKIIQKAGVSYSMKVADFGCGGSGIFSLQAAKAVGDKGIVYAVDILKSVLASVLSKARMQGINNVKTVWSNLEIFKATKIPDNNLDCGLLINTLFQSKRQKEMLQEVKRMIKREGMMLIVDWKPQGAPFGPLETDRVSAEKIEAIARDLGFQLLESFEAGPYHYGLLFTNPTP